MPARPLDHATLHHAIIQQIVDLGHAPSHAQLSEDFQVTPERMTEALRALEAYHGVVLHPHQPEVWVIHPFSTAPTPFAVRHGARLWWGNCAWCSLGVAALLGGNEITIHTTLGAEGQPITVHINEHRVLEPLWVHFPVPMTRAWDNVIYTCTTMLVFESEAAIDAWSARLRFRSSLVRPASEPRLAEMDHRGSPRELPALRFPGSHLGVTKRQGALLSGAAQG